MVNVIEESRVIATWEGLGHYTPESQNERVQTILKRSDLDWEVDVRPLHWDVDETDGIREELKSHRLMVRSDNLEPLGICGPSYIPAKNADVINFFKKYAAAGDMEIVSFGVLGGGRKIYALAKLNHSFDLGDDLIQGYFLMHHPHEWGKSLTMLFTSIRMWCLNQLSSILSSAKNRFRMPHIREFDAAAISLARS